MKLSTQKRWGIRSQEAYLPRIDCLRETIRETTVHPEALLISLPDSQFNSAKSPGGRINFNEFTWKNLDEAPDLLQESFRLRYEAYCERQKFLDASKYPNRYENDQFDQHSFHVGVIHDQTQVMTATARVVCVKNRPDEPLLPLYEHCNVDEKFHDFLEKTRCVGEISRFVMSPTALDRIVEFAVCEQAGSVGHGASSKYKASLPAILTLYKSIYQASRINGVAVLVAAMEQSLRRLVARFRFPFHQIGPEVDYYGPVAPFLLDLDELDDVLFDEAPWLLAEFYRGLEDHDIQTVWSIARDGIGQDTRQFAGEAAQ